MSKILTLRDYQTDIGERLSGLERLRADWNREDNIVGALLDEGYNDLHVVEYNQERRFVRDDYSSVEQIDLTQVGVLGGRDPWQEWHVEFSLQAVTSLGDIPIYCRHREWGDDRLHLAGGWYVLGGFKRVDMGLPIEKLTSFYVEQGVGLDLLREMEQKIRDVRLEITHSL